MRRPTGLAESALTVSSENASPPMARTSSRSEASVRESLVAQIGHLGSRVDSAADVDAKMEELAKGAGLGREIPTEWFLQDIRD